MGEEAPEFLTDEFSVVSCETATIIGNKIYVIGGSEDSSELEIGVKIFDKMTGKCCVPTVMGTKPITSKGHSAVVLNENKILILKSESSPGDCTWFLEDMLSAHSIESLQGAILNEFQPILQAVFIDGCEVDTPFVKEQKKLLNTEVVAWSKGVIGDGLKPIVISGPSGVGKGTLISKLMEDFPLKFGFSVSHTTRAPREKELNGVHYHFTERGKMEKEKREGKFLETASVHGNLYGTSIEAVDAVTDIGKRCILDIDVQGARSVRASSLKAIFIFICPPSYDELEKRLSSRGTETVEQIQKRLRNAKAEIEQGRTPGLFDHILVNDDLETCYQNLKYLLALDEIPDASHQPGVENFKIPLNRAVSKKDQTIQIICTPSMFVLDVSSLKGGAPGRTRGLDISAIVKGIEQL